MPDRIRLFGIEIDPLRESEAVARLMDWIHDGEPVARCRYVVTPNVDHARLLQESAGLRAAYADADLVLADGMPVVVASRLLGKPLPERVTGADLVTALFAAATSERPVTAYLLGAGPGVAERAARNVEARWPSVKVVGTYSPPIGFDKDEAENERILARIAEARPDALVVGLGAPKQELWVHRFRDRLQAKTAYCVGATIDFLAGEKKRAPRWMQRAGLEWLHRMLTEPRRLARRYAHDAWVFPKLVLREWRRT
jgi:N-acetylglucosaminyldiphosphoundecaprenol N-acetyl-beta-D-mannosaminyltransferase